MKIRQLSLALALALFSCRFAAAQLADSEKLAGIAPFVNERTVAVVKLNLKALDLKGGYDRVEKQWSIPDDQSTKVRAVLKTVEFVRSQLTAAGANEIYLVASAGPDDKAPPAFVVLPVAVGKDPTAVVDIAKSLPGIEAEPFVQQGAVVLAPPDTAVKGAKDLVKAIKPLKRPEFAAALAAAGNADLQVLFVPNTELLTEAKSVSPVPLDGAGDLPDAVKWMAVSINLPPKAAFSLVTNMKDEASAADALARLNKLLDGPNVKELRQDPATDKAITALTPKQKGTELRLVLNETNGGIEAVADGIRANLGKAIEAAQKAGIGR